MVRSALLSSVVSTCGATLGAPSESKKGDGDPLPVIHHMAIFRTARAM
jgi:hypothetical protein